MVYSIYTLNLNKMPFPRPHYPSFVLKHTLMSCWNSSLEAALCPRIPAHPRHQGFVSFATLGRVAAEESSWERAGVIRTWRAEMVLAAQYTWQGNTHLPKVVASAGAWGWHVPCPSFTGWHLRHLGLLWSSAPLVSFHFFIIPLHFIPSNLLSLHTNYPRETSTFSLTFLPSSSAKYC